MTKDQKAQIARTNGAKSKGPKTDEGKNRSRANALTHGQRALTLRHLAEPHPAVLCNEDVRAYYKLFNDLIATYLPIGPVALDIVREITSARWEMTRVQTLKSAAYNRAFLQEKHQDHKLPEELLALECMLNATQSLLPISADFDRAIDRLHIRTARLERRLRFLNLNFPSTGPIINSAEPDAEPSEPNTHEPTQPEPTEVIENTNTAAKSDKPLVTDDPSESTRAAYEYFFPGRELIVIEPQEPEAPEETSKKPS